MAQPDGQGLLNHVIDGDLEFLDGKEGEKRQRILIRRLPPKLGRFMVACLHGFLAFPQRSREHSSLVSVDQADQSLESRTVTQPRHYLIAKDSDRLLHPF